MSSSVTLGGSRTFGVVVVDGVEFRDVVASVTTLNEPDGSSSTYIVYEPTKLLEMLKVAKAITADGQRVARVGVNTDNVLLVLQSDH